jgi:DUF1365 family protein
MSVSVPTTLSANGAVPGEAAVLYVGEVMHARLKPLQHRFVYKVANLLIDIDRLAEANTLSRFFSVGRFNLFSFHERDHGARDGGLLRAHVDMLMAAAGLERAPKVLLLCYPRVMGFVFNPISVYFALNGNGTATALIYEVRNTFGESHTYVVPVEPGQQSEAGLRQTRAKRFFVSPFMPMEQRYHFRVMPPGNGVRVRILETDTDGPTLSATFVGQKRGLTARAILGVFAAMPLYTLKIVAAIHWEAVKLWFKGAPYFTRGEVREAFSVADSKTEAALTK